MKSILINYAHNRFIESQKNNSRTGIEIGGFDEVRSYGFNDIDESFKRRNWHILNHFLGAGHWLWKPYINWKTLNDCSNGDVVFYCDSGISFIQSALPLLELCADNDVVPFDIGYDESDEVKFREREQTKRDVFYFMNCDDVNDTEVYDIHTSDPRYGSFQIYKKTDFTMQFVNLYLRYCEDYRLITDAPNTCGYPEYPEHISHRHDQSIFSVLTKQLNIVSHQDPSQWGPCKPVTDNYSQILNHHRNSS